MDASYSNVPLSVVSCWSINLLHHVSSWEGHSRINSALRLSKEEPMGKGFSHFLEVTNPPDSVKDYSLLQRKKLMKRHFCLLLPSTLCNSLSSDTQKVSNPLTRHGNYRSITFYSLRPVPSHLNYWSLWYFTVAGLSEWHFSANKYDHNIN